MSDIKKIETDFPTGTTIQDSRNNLKLAKYNLSIDRDLFNLYSRKGEISFPELIIIQLIREHYM